MRSRTIDAQLPRLSLEEFLEREASAKERHEFHDGLVTMMVASSPEHSMIAARVIRELSNLAKGSSRNVFNCNLAVWIAASKSHLYPDMSLTCGKAQANGLIRTQITNPKLIVEVLSPSTRDYDLSGKFSLYQAIPTLEEYLAFETDKPELYYWSKGPGAKWTRKKIAGLNAAVQIRALGKPLALSEIYENLQPK